MQKIFAAPEKRSTRSRTRHFELTLRSVIDRSLLAYDISRHGKRNTQNEQRQAALKHQFGRDKPERHIEHRHFFVDAEYIVCYQIQHAAENAYRRRF